MNEIYEDRDLSVHESGEQLFLKIGREFLDLDADGAERLAEALSVWAMEKKVEAESPEDNDGNVLA